MVDGRLGVAVWLWIVAAATVIAAQSTRADAERGRDRPDPRIAAADERRVETARSTGPWRNPSLVIGADGVDLIAQGVPSGRATVAVADLRRTLVNLPIEAWPLGRVAAVQDNGLRAVDTLAVRTHETQRQSVSIMTRRFGFFGHCESKSCWCPAGRPSSSPLRSAPADVAGRRA